MKDFITPEIVEKCISIVKAGEYDLDKFVLPVAENAPCSITQADFPLIIDMALKCLKRQARNNPLETFIEFDFDKKRKPDKQIIPITIFQDRKEQFAAPT